MTVTDAALLRVPGVGDLVVRPYRGEADLDEVVRIQNAEWAADGVRERSTRDGLRAWWGHPSEHFDASRDVRIVELDGRAVAVNQAEWTDASDGVREYRTRCWIDPPMRRRGIGRALLAWSEGARGELAATHATDRPKVLGLGCAETNAGARALAQDLGYEAVRWFADMERSLLEPLPEVPPLPEGLSVRPVTREDAPAIWRADHEAFRDHWGGFDDSEAAYRRWLDAPEFQPDLMVVAWDGDEIAGAVLNAVYAEENAELGVARGWLDSVFTRRAWRRRGLARGLIVRSLHLLRERGLEVAVLGVDADNPSGAFGLYGSVGFAARERFVLWRKPLEPMEVDR